MDEVDELLSAPGSEAVLLYDARLANRPDPLPLSYAQQRMLRSYESLVDPLGFQLIQYVELEGDLDAGALETALAQVAARHPALRTAFKREGWDITEPDLTRYAEAISAGAKSAFRST